MPKIRDLGIKVVPETMRPPEVGPGGGCHGLTYPPKGRCEHTFVVLCNTGTGCDCTFTLPCCPGSCDPTSTAPYYDRLTPEAIAQLRADLQQKLAALDEQEKNLGPKTFEEIDAREKELKAELDALAARRKELKSKK